MGDLCIDDFPAVVGRGSACDITVRVGFVSRNHCRFVRRGEEVFVQDLGSINGTFVNGRPARFLTVIHHGDEVRLGPISYRAAILAGPNSGTMLQGPTPTELPAW
jgi:pSer/pThr/pTyr-binding forkhead associated (FHA) protein